MTSPPDVWARDCARSLERSRARRAAAVPPRHPARIAAAGALIAAVVILGATAVLGIATLFVAVVLIIAAAAVYGD